MSTRSVLSLCLVFGASLLVQVSHQGRFYFFIETQKNQTDARSFCRAHYTDLATFNSSAEFAALQNPCASDCWIGLQRLADLSNLWIWSDGETNNVTNWQSGEPNNMLSIENCVILRDSFWYDAPCARNYSFLCFVDEPILVRQNKTWEEALDTCRNLHLTHNYFKHNYDLYQMRSQDFFSTIQNAMVTTQTQDVWIGLRYLTGTWLWLKNNPLQVHLPSCPAAGNYCGTITKGGEIQGSNCAAKRFFFCSTN
ncbi:P-selectin-like [Betta splendens]|uniref:P-selectin-like n=1 Tax=Betta splendens TaxID=158456 RepID=A0A6P7M235_BETSP|nr:P-selectin-like [Betta splendens]